MRKNMVAAMLVLVLSVSMSGCFSLSHTVGTGAKGGSSVSETQWYALWGLVPLGQVDSKAMAGGSANYTVDSGMSFLDGLINIFTSYVTVVRQTVTVTK